MVDLLTVGENRVVQSVLLSKARVHTYLCINSFPFVLMINTNLAQKRELVLI